MIKRLKSKVKYLILTHIIWEEFQFQSGKGKMIFYFLEGSSLLLLVVMLSTDEFTFFNSSDK